MTGKQVSGTSHVPPAVRAGEIEAAVYAPRK